MRRHPVWDLPCRLSHWAIAVLFVLLFISGQFGWLSTRAHLWLGYALLAIVVFRILWGWVGSDSARFSHFLRGPVAFWRYLIELPGKRPMHWPGHNPVGGWSVVIMLTLLLIQCVTGLFVETWGESRGPLAERIDRHTALVLGDLHATLHWLLGAIVLIHIAAVIYYRVRKGEDRIGPMLGHGRIALPEPPELRFAGFKQALAVLTVSLAIVAGIIVFGPI